MKSFLEFLIENDEHYRGQHEAPDKEGAPMHDLTHNGVYPDDVYSHNGFRYYHDHGTHIDRESHDRTVSKHGHPGARVEIYRAIPKDLKHKKGEGIRAGDWVTHNRKYALDHGRSALNGNFKIVKRVVAARELYTDGNSPHEWGYHPTPHDGEHEKAAKAKAKALKERLRG